MFSWVESTFQVIKSKLKFWAHGCTGVMLCYLLKEAVQRSKRASPMAPDGTRALFQLWRDCFEFLLFPILTTFFVTRMDLCGATFCTHYNVCQDNERLKIWISSTDGKIWKHILEQFLIAFISPTGLLIAPLRNHVVAKEKSEGSAT